MKWHFDLATDTGGRAEQQDRVEILAAPDRPDEHLVVLADGMGGQQQGAVAAQAVIDTARGDFSRAVQSDPRQFLTDLCFRAHEAILRAGRQHDTNPATTCTALLVRGDEAYWIHVGDSRLYHFNAENLLSRTCDHTVAELLRDRTGTAPAEPAPGRCDNRLYMCLGGQNELEPEFGATAVGDNDWFMLCSDGFWTQVDEVEVAQAQMGLGADNKAASGLAAMATARGGAGGDNLSLVLAAPRQSAAKKAWWRLVPPGMRFGK